MTKRRGPRRRKTGSHFAAEGRLSALQRGLLGPGFERKVRYQIRKNGCFGVDSEVQESLTLQARLLFVTDPHRRR